MLRPLAIVATMFLSGCSLFGSQPPPPILNIPGPPPEWKAPAKPLPELPKCGHLQGEKAKIACRAEYDAIVRRMYVDLAMKNESLVGFVERLGLQDNTWTTETNR